MRYGYARVSTDQQDYASQVEGLKAAGCERIVSEKISGVLVRLIEAVGPGSPVPPPSTTALLGFLNLRVVEFANETYSTVFRTWEWRKENQPIIVIEAPCGWH